MRCFIAIELPEDVRKEILRIQEELRRLDLDAKWVEFENLHITLKFLGEIKEDILSGIEGVLSDLTLEVKPFQLSLSRLGAFPRIERPRVLWVGLHPSDNFMRIVDFLEERFFKLGFPREKRKTHPHITLARLRSYRNTFKIKEKLEKLILDKKSWLVDSVILFKSMLTPQGPIYEKIFSKSLTT